jgi:hypothetical protein
MSIKWYSATEMTGDDSALDMVPNPGDFTDLSNGDKCFVLVNNLHLRIYEYNTTSEVADDFFGLSLIPADNATGQGTWLQVRTSGLITTLAGSFANQIHGLVTESGGTVSLDFEGDGSIPGLGIWSDELVSVPIQSVELNAGTDEAPTANFVHILKADPTVLVTDTEWPATEHIKVAYILCPSAAYVAADGAYINQNWNDGNEPNGMGHRTMMGENIRLTMDGAHWHSGVAGNGLTDGYITIDTDDTPDSAYFLSTAGVCYQMHQHTIPAKDTENGSDIHVVNAFGEPYKPIHDIRDIEVDALNGSLTNKYYNVVFWMVANKSGEYAPVMMNMPTGSYVGLSSAINDVDGFDVYDIPREFKEESSTGFLVCRITFRQTASAIVVHNTTDLRGRTPGTASGTSIGGDTEFADNQFQVFNILDNTKIIDLDLSGITTGNTRTIEIPDVDMVIPKGTVAGSTTLQHAGEDILQTYYGDWGGGNGWHGLQIFAFGGVADGGLIFVDDPGNLVMRVQEDGAHFQIYGEKATDVAQLIFDGVGAGSAALYYNGIRTFETGAGQVTMYNFDASESVIFYNETVVNGIFEIRNNQHGGRIVLSAENTATGATKWLFLGDPDGEVNLYYAGVLKLNTKATGVAITGGGGDHLDLVDDGSNNFSIVNFADGKTLALKVSDSEAAVQTGVLITPDGATELYFAGVAVLVTTADGIDLVQGDIKWAGGILTSNGTDVRFKNAADTEVLAKFVPAGGVVLYYAGDVRFSVTNPGATLVGTLIANGMTLGDDEPIYFGAEPDAQIKSEGGILVITNGPGGKNMATFTPDGGCRLYNNNNLKLATSGSGITVTGTIIADGLTFGDGEYIKFGAGPDASISSNGTSLLIQNGAANETLAKFKQNDAVTLFFNNAIKIATTVTGVTITGKMVSDDTDGNQWTSQQGFTEVTLIDGATAWDLNVAQSATVDLDENTTIGAPTNGQIGTTYILRVHQSASYTLSWNAVFKFGSSNPDEPAANGDMVIFSFYWDGFTMHGVDAVRNEA